MLYILGISNPDFFLTPSFTYSSHPSLTQSQTLHPQDVTSSGSFIVCYSSLGSSCSNIPLYVHNRYILYVSTYILARIHLCKLNYIMRPNFATLCNHNQSKLGQSCLYFFSTWIQDHFGCLVSLYDGQLAARESLNTGAQNHV